MSTKRFASRTDLGLCFCWEADAEIRINLWFDEPRENLTGITPQALIPEGRQKQEFSHAKVIYPVVNRKEEVIGIEYFLYKQEPLPE